MTADVPVEHEVTNDKPGSFEHHEDFDKTE